jgi:hypothetical protein
MTTYQVYFRSDLQWGRHDFDAETPEQALALAQRFAEEKWDVLDLDYYEACDCPINDIEVCDAEHNLLAVWLDDDMRLRRAARDLLDALEQAVQALNTAPRFAVRHLDTDSYKIAAVCDRAIARAKGGAA